MFLVGERAYKLKKPLVLPFLDYGTPARRRRMCREEVRLNRVLAPDIYLGVRGLAALVDELALVDERDPRALDFVVEMRRYDEARTLAATLERGEIARAEIDAVGQTLAGFHASCRAAPVIADPASAVRREIDENITELLPLVTGPTGARERVLSLWRFLNAFVSAHSEMLDARARRGSIRECHGDLRAEHVLLGEPPEVVDCVEFDPGLRTLDVADDLAFLVMDLTALGGERFAGQLAEAYRDAGGDPGSDALLAFYACHRALIRLKVLLVRASQLQSGTELQGQEISHARDLLAVAEGFAWRARAPLMLVVCGVPASGKSYLSAGLAAASHFHHISSDVTRKQLAGLQPDETASADRYSDQFSRATYAELGRRARLEVAERGAAIVDATFRRRVDREAFAQTFADAAPAMFVQCDAPADVLAERAMRRKGGERHGSDATMAVVVRERDNWEPLDEVVAAAHLIMRSDRSVELLLAELVTVLDHRLSECGSATA